MTAEQNKEKYRRVIEEAWNRGNLSMLDEVCSPHYIGHDPSMTIRGLEAFKQYIALFRKAFPDTHMTIDDEVAEGDTVVIRWTSTGTHKGEIMGIPPSGRCMSVTGISMVRFVNGKNVEGWFNYDTMGMLQQIGAMST